MKKFMFLVCGCLMAMNSVAQQQLGQRARVQSPVVNADGTVTFNFYSPSAQRVSVSGDFDEIRNQRLEMTKQENGVWTVTTKALNPELYSYSLSVDGQRFVDPANSYVNRDISTLSNIFIVTKSNDDKGHLYSVNDVPHGTLSRVWYDSPTLGQQRRMTVYLPAAYDGKKAFPVMYLLHGHGGDETAWGDLGRASQIMDNLIAEGKCVPMIVVMPNGNPTCNAAPGWWHEGMYTPDGNAFNQRGAKASMEESFMDIVNFVDSHYKTVKKRSGRAVTGLSMGGGHTFGISRLYPETFDYYGLQSAAARVQQNDAKFNEQMSRLFSSKPKLFWIAIGKEDFLIQQNNGLRQYLDAHNYPYEYYENDGGHIWRNWRIYLSMFAQKIFRD
ncbi:MAG: esterase [Bacteroidaceae bacterium]|nr:esterase [Bacteroidaceae bacterium]MBQ7141830.1 esterase [Bacteroidaceae bacterium]MBR6974648.1 esterase [Bacteroidaceae bacterium]MDO4202335.1 alpha/beta hydrolase-fold protein [Bacteroidales bacterium]